MATPQSPARSAALQYLEKVVTSEVFRSALRSQRLLRFLVEQTLNGQAERIKEYAIGSEALGRGASFDPRIDSIARVEVSRLRGRLDQYYATEGRADSLIIVLPKGSYVPQFESRREIPISPSGTRPLSWFALGAGTAACVLGAIWFWSARQSRPESDAPLMRFEVELRSGGQLGSIVGTHAVISPDGSRIVFVASDANGVSHLYTRRVSEPEISEMPDTEGARGPFFSTGGQWVVYWSHSKLWKTPTAGGSPIPLCDATDLLGGSWGDDGTIVATLNSSNQLWRIPSEGGAPVPVPGLQPGAERLLWPQILPGSKAVLYTSASSVADSGTIEAFSFRDHTRKTLVRGGTFGRYLPTGNLIFVNQGTLYGVAMDPNRLETTGTPVEILSGVDYSPVFGFAQFAFSQNGIFLYRRATARGQVTVQWLDVKGNVQPLIPKPGSYLWPSLSPDGRRLALQDSTGGNSKIVLVDIPGGRLMPLTAAGSAAMRPMWSPDGKSIVFSGAKTLESVKADGSGSSRALGLKLGLPTAWSFSPDSTRLAFYAMSPVTHFDLWTAPVQFAGGEWRAAPAEIFLQTKSVETYPAFSPDGRWIAYASNESGSFEVYVRAYPPQGLAVQVSKGGGRIARWASRSGELFYATDDQRIMIASLRMRKGSLQVDPPRLWSDVRLADTGVLANFDVTPDGRRLVALLPPARPREQQAVNHVTLLINFFDEVRRRASGKEK